LITVALQVFSGDGDIYASFDLKRPNYYETGGDLPFQSILLGSDWIHIQHCFEKEETASLYVGIDAWVAGSYQLVASTAGIKHSLAFVSLFRSINLYKKKSGP